MRTARKNTSRGWVYVDEAGKPWHRAKCPECKRVNDTACSRRHGHKSVDACMAPRSVKGRLAEYAAAEWLRQRGYLRVQIGTGRGPDITAEQRGTVLRFEVKSVVKQSSSHGLFVHAVGPRRRGDDYIIYVYGDNCIMEAMTKHLKQCWKHGARNVTSLFRSEAT